MLPKTPGLLWDIRDGGEFILEISAGRSEQDLVEDEFLQTLVERKFELMGEAARRLAHYDPETANRLAELADLIGLRNIIAHRYDQIDYGKLWAAIVSSIPAMMRQINDLLDNSGSSL